MKKPLSPTVIAVVAAVAVVVLGFFAFRAFGTQGLSPEEQRQEKVMIERSNADSLRLRDGSGGPGASGMSPEEAKARGAAGQTTP